ncbi:MAG: HAD family hydrolase [Planctomycetales bacterium]|nr:HAD family hydrolase [Planctomycetales bacterium]
MKPSLPANLKAIIFDLDDTLYLERDYVASGMRAVAAWIEERDGFPSDETFIQLWDLFVAGVRGDTFNRWLKNRGIEADGNLAEMVEAYRHHDPQIVLLPDVKELLNRLRQHYRLGIITDGPLGSQQQKVVALGLESLFEEIVFTAELGEEYRKPSKVPFQRVLRTFGVGAADSVYVGDNPSKDFRGARLLGMWTARIRHVEGLYSHLEPESLLDAPHVEFPTLIHLEDALGGVTSLD